MIKSEIEKNKFMPQNAQATTLADENETLYSLSMSALLAKNAVPASHKRIADNYIVIKRIYKFHVVQSRITNQEIALLKKYDFNTLENSTIKQINEELAFLKKWSYSMNEDLATEADEILQIRSKELKFIVSSGYAKNTSEIYDGYKALEKYFEEITKFYRTY